MINVSTGPILKNDPFITFYRIQRWFLMYMNIYFRYEYFNTVVFRIEEAYVM